MSFKRPRPVREEDENDLLKLQEEFLLKKEACSVEVIKKNDDKPAIPVNEPAIETGDDKIDDNHDIPNLFGLNIVERDTSKIKRVPVPKAVNVPFPKATRRTEKEYNQKKSLFAQHVIKAKSHAINKSQILDGSGLGAQGSEELQKIHEDNIQMLKEMSSEEIEEARNEILKQLDPKLVEFLKAKKITKSKISLEDSTPQLLVEKKSPSVEISSENSLPIPTEEIKSKKWLNMDKIEEKKLEWMKPIKPSETNKSKEARFNFEGILISGRVEDISTKEGLHHHGEDPEKAGYTINELITFIESSLPAQKLVGLQVLGKVVEKSHKGLFDLCFSSSVAKQILEETPLLLSIRTCLDDKSNSVVCAAISCIKDIICNTEIDEFYLDRLFVWNYNDIRVPYLAPKISETKLDDCKDEQLMIIDPIKGLLRTDLLKRIRYLLDNDLQSQDDPHVLKNIFDILIRIARHSPESALAITSCPFLLETLAINFLKPQLSFEVTSVYSNPFFKTLKLMRVLCTTNPKIIDLLVENFPHILQSCQIYVTIDPSCYQSEGKFKCNDALQLAIESLRFWCVLLSSNVKFVSSHLLELFPVLIQQTRYMLSLNLLSDRDSQTSFDWQYAATLILCLRYLTRQESHITSGFTPLIQSVAFGWIKQITNENLLPNTDIVSAISEALIYCLSVTRSTDDLLLIKDNALFPLLRNAPLWARIMDNLVDCSPTINFNENSLSSFREAGNLPSFGALAFGGKETLQLCPLLKDNSLFRLISSLTTIMEALNDNSVYKEVLTSGPLLRYVACLNHVHDLPHWNLFEKHELHLLTKICIFSKAVPAQASHYLPLSLTLVSSINEVNLKTRILDAVIFYASLYSLNLNLNPAAGEEERPTNLNSDKQPAATLSSIAALASQQIDDIKAVYKNWSDVDSKLWIFDPIMNMMKVDEKEREVNPIRKCLAFSLLIQQMIPDYFERTIPSLEVQLALVASTFLAGDDFFFDQEVARSLEVWLCYFKANSSNLLLHANTRLPHILNVSALFDQFVEQYEALSYGNSLFTDYLQLIQSRSEPSLRARR